MKLARLVCRPPAQVLTEQAIETASDRSLTETVKNKRENMNTNPVGELSPFRLEKGDLAKIALGLGAIASAILFFSITVISLAG